MQHLTRTPSVDDPAEEDAIAREQRRARRKPKPPNATRPRGGTGCAPAGAAGAPWTPGRIGDALIKAWEHAAGRKHPGTDGFEDDRTRDQRLGQALLDLMADYLGQPRPQPRLREQPAGHRPDRRRPRERRNPATPTCIDAPCSSTTSPIEPAATAAQRRQPTRPGGPGQHPRACSLSRSPSPSCGPPSPAARLRAAGCSTPGSL